MRREMRRGTPSPAEISGETGRRPRTPAILPTMLFGIAVSGCGVAVGPSGESEDAESTAAASSPEADMAMASSGSPSPQMAAEGGPAGSYGGSADPAMSAQGGSAPGSSQPGDPAAYGGYGAPGGSPTPEDAAAYGDPALEGYGAEESGDPYGGVDPAQMEEMRELYEQQGGPEGGVDPAEMEEMRELYGQQQGGPDLDAQMEAELRQRGGPAGAAGEAEPGDFEGRGGSRASQFEEGTPAHVVMLLVEAVDAEDLETAARYIDERADGTLGSIRDGDISEVELERLQTYFARMEPFNARVLGRAVQLTFRGGSDKMLIFKVGKQRNEFIVESLDVRDAGSARGR